MPAGAGATPVLPGLSPIHGRPIEARFYGALMPSDGGLLVLREIEQRMGLPARLALLLRPGKTPSGAEIRNYLRRLVRRIRSHWPTTRLTIRGDGHYGRPELMAW